MTLLWGWAQFHFRAFSCEPTRMEQGLNLPMTNPQLPKTKAGQCLILTLAKHPSCMLTTEKNIDKEYRYYELIIKQKILFWLSYHVWLCRSFVLRQRGCHVGENPGNLKKMVLFLMFFPGFGCIKEFSLLVNAREMCLSLLMECKQSKVASSLHLLSSSVNTRLICWKKIMCFLDQWIGRKSSGGRHYRQLRCIQVSCRGTP